jgi:hypothetical protein
MTLFDFTTMDEQAWNVVNDGVMGGDSKGHVELTGEGTLEFTGTLVTEGGGFTSVRTRGAFDLKGYDGLALRVRGGGRTFQVEVSDSGTRGDLSRRASFETSEEWKTVRAFSALEASFRGRAVDAEPLDPSSIERIGLYIADGQNGPFRLEVSEIRAYREEG